MWWVPQPETRPSAVCVNRTCLISRTPLHLACENGHADIVRFLAENQCRLDPRDKNKKTPLMRAVEFGHEDCAATLLELGAQTDLRDFVGNTALHLATLGKSKRLVELLLEHNAHIDAVNMFTETPLVQAINIHCEEMVELLLQKGADVNARLKNGRIHTYLKELTCDKEFSSVQECSAHEKVDSTLASEVDPEDLGKESAGVLLPDAGGHKAETGSLAEHNGNGVLPAAGTQQEGDYDSWSDSESDPEAPEKESAGVQVPNAGGHTAATRSLTEQHSNGYFFIV
ncbi:uncharacterized protein ACIB01_014340 [Guaruba guarouba]